MINIITNIKSPKKWDLTKLVDFILTDMGHNDITLTISYNDSICNHYSTSDIQIDALLDKSTKLDKCYNLIIRQYAPLKEVICHELVHLDQYERGDLKLNKTKDKLYFIWKDEEYDPSTQYKHRPWEEEAFSMQHELWKKFKKQCVNS